MSRRIHYARIAFLLVLSIVLLLPMTAFAETAAGTAGIKVTINGKGFTPKSAPYRESGTIYLPLRDMGELLGTTIAWLTGTKTAVLNYPQLTIKLQVSETTATVNGNPVLLTAPMQVVGGRIYVPLRFLSEATGADVKWAAGANTIRITRSDEYLPQTSSEPTWLNRQTGEIYMAKNEQTPVSLLGKLDGKLQGTSVLIDGKEAISELVRIVRSGTSFVPIRAVTAAFGLPVVWDSASRSVNLMVKVTEQRDKG